MKIKPYLWDFLLKTQLILGVALVTSIPAIAGEVPTAKQPASATRDVPETAIAQNLDQQTVPSATESPLNLDNTTDTLGSDDPLGQVTNISQLRDVQPTDWAYQAVRNLVERYGCIAGYPDGTFRGNRAMSRYEFAAGLNSCLQQIEKLIASSRDPNAISREDLASLQRLKDEFIAELATIRTRVDNLEAHTDQLEPRQFSTTTRLNGEAIFGVYNAFTGSKPILEAFRVFGGRIPFEDPIPPGSQPFIEIDRGTRDFDSNTTFGQRVRLNFDTSFFGADLLKTRLQVLGASSLGTVTNTPQTELEFNARPFQNANNNVNLDTLYYRFPLGRQAQALVAASARLTDIADPVNPYFNSGGLGAISRFGQFNPIYRLGAGAGVGLKLKLNNTFGLDLGYLGGGQSYTEPSPNGDFLRGPYGAIAQLNFTPSDRFRAALTYVNSYNFDPEVGSNLSNPRQLLGSFKRVLDPDNLVNVILLYLRANGTGPDALLGRQLISSLGLSRDLQNQLALRPTSQLANITLGEVLTGAIQQRLTGINLATAGVLTPAQLNQLQQAGVNPQQLAAQLVQQGGLTPAQVSALNAAGVTTTQINTALNQLNLPNVGTTATGTIATPGQTPLNQFVAQQPLSQLFPGVNGLSPNQTLGQALANAGYTGAPEQVTINQLLTLRLFNAVGATPVTVNVGAPIGTSNLTNVTLTPGGVAQLGNQTLGSVSLADVLNASTPETQAAVGASAPVRRAFKAVNVSNILNILSTSPVANKPVGDVTTRDLATAFVNSRLLDEGLSNLGANFPVISNSYGLEFSWLISRGFAFGGWAGYTNTRTLEDISLLGTTLVPRGDNKTVNAAINFAFPDLGKRGNLGGIIVGVQPITYQTSFGAGDQGPGYHIEGLYRYQVSDNLSITPGILWLTHPDHNLSTKDIVVGTIRTTFTF